MTEMNIEHQKLYDRYASVIEVNSDLNRQMVSAQINKKRPFYRWFKYKEAFSVDLVQYCII